MANGAGIALAAIPATSATNVTQVITDSVKPRLLSYTFDLNTGRLTMSFNEQVRHVVLGHQCYTIQFPHAVRRQYVTM